MYQEHTFKRFKTRISVQKNIYKNMVYICICVLKEKRSVTSKETLYRKKLIEGYFDRTSQAVEV